MSLFDDAPFGPLDPAPYFANFFSQNADGATGGMYGIQTIMTVPDAARTAMGASMMAASPAGSSPAAIPGVPTAACSWWDVVCKGKVGAQGAIAYAGVILLAIVLVYGGIQFFKESGE